MGGGCWGCGVGKRTVMSTLYWDEINSNGHTITAAVDAAGVLTCGCATCGVEILKSADLVEQDDLMARIASHVAVGLSIKETE